MQNQQVKTLREIDRNIWVVEQPQRYLGLSVGTRMSVIRLDNGEIAVISPIQPTDGLRQQLSDLGTIKHVIAPNLYHYLFAADFKACYPEALLWATSGLDAKQPKLPIDRIIDEGIEASWPGLDWLPFSGFRTLGLNGFDALNECVFFHRLSRTLILTDTAFNFDESFPLTTRLVTQVIGGYKSLSPSILEKIATTDKSAIKKSVEYVLNWDFERVIMAHGSIVAKGGKEKFKQGYDRFLA